MLYFHWALDSYGPMRPPPLKLENIWFFGVKSWFFTRNTSANFAPPSAIGKNMIFWRKIVIFHTKYPNKFRASLRSAQFFRVRPPLTLNPGSAPGFSRYIGLGARRANGPIVLVIDVLFWFFLFFVGIFNYLTDYVSSLLCIKYMLSGYSAAQEIKQFWKFISGFIGPQFLNFEKCLGLSMGPQSSLVLLAKFLLEAQWLYIVDVFNVFYHTKTTSDTETDFP
jgi:hypothetical protein